MTISKINNDRVYFEEFDDGFSKNHKKFGFKCHGSFVGWILSWKIFDKTFKLEDGTWANKNSAISYLKRNAHKIYGISDAQLEELHNLPQTITADSTSKIFQRVILDIKNSPSIFKMTMDDIGSTDEN